MFVRLLTLFMPLTFAACQIINIDISHVETDRGYLNSASDDLGQLYLFNLDGSFIEPLAIVPASKGTTRGKRWNRVRAKDLDGYEIGGEVDKAVRAHIRTEIARGSSLELQNMQKEAINESISVLARYIRANRDAQNLDEDWKLAEATAPDSTWRYAIVHTTVNADRAIARHQGATEVGGGFNIPFGWAGSAEVQLNGFAEDEFEGDQIPALVRFYVFKAKYNAENNYDFEVRGKDEKDAFIDLLKD